MVEIIDCTLREGRQSPFVDFSTEFSAVLAKKLARLGVYHMEVGHPAAATWECERVNAIREASPEMSILGHARANQDDIAAVQEAGCDWVGIFLGINEYSRQFRIPSLANKTAVELACEAVEFAKSRGLFVRFTLEDASRTAYEDVLEVMQAAASSGADRLCFSDTVGCLAPEEVCAVVRRLVDDGVHLPLEIHLHDDRGLATANALAAIGAGVGWLSASVNGLGERVGILDLCELLGNLHFMGQYQVDGPALQDISRTVATFSRRTVNPDVPVVGEFAFTHTSQLHRRAVERDQMTYSWLAPEELGRSTKLATKWEIPKIDDLITKPEVIPASELAYHRDGPGFRYVMVDDRFVDDSRVYCIARTVFSVDKQEESHVDPHTHHVDSLFVFLGAEDDLTGLQVEVMLDGEVRQLASPCSVLIPSGRSHTYRFLGGSGIFLNYVMAGNYNESLYELEDGNS